MMYVGERPWHGLGKELPMNATWEEAKEVVGFYTAEKRPVFAAGVQGAIPGKVALVRTDTNQALAVVTPRYGIVQFDDLAKSIMEACGKEAVFHTAGLLGDLGERGWLLGEIPGEIRVKGDESPIRKYFLGVGAHNGMDAAQLVNCATRVVCANTVAAALSETENHRWTIRHTLNASQRLADATKAFKNLCQGYEVFGQVANLMAATKMTDEQTVKVLDTILPIPDDGEVHPKTRNQRDEVMRLSLVGTGIGASLRGTAWGFYQGVTEWADHKRNATKSLADKMESVWLGSSAAIKQSAFTSILNVTGIQQAA